jgi:hypothetical protein
MYPDFHDIAGGRVTGKSMTQKFGYNAACTTGEDIWAAGGAYTGFLASPSAIEVVAGANDVVSSGTGAWSITLTGISGTTYDTETAHVDLNGTNVVTVPGTWLRVQRAYVTSTGTGGVNAGAITIRVASAGATLATIGAGDGQTLIAAYTTPIGTYGTIVRWGVGTSKAGGAQASGVYALQTDTGGGWRTREIVALNAGQNYEKDLNIEAGQLCDIRVRCISASSEVLVSATFDVLEETPSA